MSSSDLRWPFQQLLCFEERKLENFPSECHPSWKTALRDWTIHILLYSIKHSILQNHELYEWFPPCSFTFRRLEEIQTSLSKGEHRKFRCARQGKQQCILLQILRARIFRYVVMNKLKGLRSSSSRWLDCNSLQFCLFTRHKLRFE